MTVDRKKLGKRSRRKGKTWERRIVRLLKPIFGDGVHRGHQDNRGGIAAGEGCDVEGTPFWIEAKHKHLTNPRAALRQCCDVQKKNGDTRPSVAVCKDDKPPPDWSIGKSLSPPTIMMELSDWLNLIKDWVRLKELAGEDLTLIRNKRNCR